MKIPNILGRRRSEKQIEYLSKQMDKSIKAKKKEAERIAKRNQAYQKEYYSKNKGQ